MAGVYRNAKRRVGQHLDDRAFELDRILFRHAPRITPESMVLLHAGRRSHREAGVTGRSDAGCCVARPVTAADRGPMQQDQRYIPQ
jgi:hypothetical protein